MYSRKQEYASVTVTIQNSSPDETAYDVQCVISAKNGESGLARNFLDFETIRAGGSKTISTSVNIYNSPRVCRNFECLVTWSDSDGNNCQTQATVLVYFYFSRWKAAEILVGKEFTFWRGIRFSFFIPAI
jgi:hypothetical protein